MGSEIAIRDSAPSEVYVFEEGQTRGEIVCSLAERIPQNEFGLPIFFLRSDLLSGYSFSSEDIDAASVGLFYHEGFPTLENGAAFWNQLPHEPQANFEIFQAYLDQAADIGIRQLDLLSIEPGVRQDVATLSNMSKEFFWTSRARAYDLFIVAAEAKKRQHRIRKMENTHFVKAQGLFDALLKRFDGEFENWIEELDAKEAIEVMSELVKIQRMSVGLTGQHASSTARDFAQGDTSESMIRKLAQGGGVSQGSGGQFMQQLQSLLDNPEEGAILQAAVLKVTAPNNRERFSEDF